MHPDYMPGYLAFRLQDELSFPSHYFSESFIQTTRTASAWWKMIYLKEEKLRKLPKNFVEFIINLHNCPASTGSLERFFSTFGLVWTKVRNRLGFKKAEMLVRVYRFLKSKSKYNEDEDNDSY